MVISMEKEVEQIRQQLHLLADEKYQEFQSKLLPGVDNIIGVRTPDLRKIAKKIAKGDWRGYLKNSKSDFFEEDMLYGLVISYVSIETEERKMWLEQFLFRNHNWAVCDICTGSFKFMKEEPEVWFHWLEEQLKKAINDVGKGCGAEQTKETLSGEEKSAGADSEYVIRFVVVAFLAFFLTDDKIDEVLEWYERINHEGYYVKMAVAWGISMCYILYREKTWKLLEKNTMDDFTHNKAIQKIRESYKVSKEEKVKLLELKR